MAIFTKNKFEELAQERGEYCISIYIPTTRSGNNKESSIRLKNQLNKIETELSENLGLKPKEIEEYLKPIVDLLNDSNIWRHMSDTLIVFRSKDNFYYTTLTTDTHEFSMVSDRYYLLPLLSMFNNNSSFFLLTLSLNNNKLFEATQNEISEIVTDDILPKSIKESVGKDFEQKSLQFRTGQTGEGRGMFHGKGEGKDDKNKEAIKYLTDVSNGLDEILTGYNVPLVVAAVDNIFSMFKEVSSYKNISSEFVAGNPEEEDIFLIHEKACDILVPYFNKARNENKKRYQENSKNTLSDLKEVIKASYAGTIDTLFVKKDEIVWGTYDAGTNKAEIHKQRNKLDYCLLDFSARETFLKGGKVFLEDYKNLPEPDTVANALLRF